MTYKALSRKIYLQYYRYKDSPYFKISIYVFVLFMSIILFFNSIIPQATNWLSVRKEVDATRERISVMNTNIAYLQSLNQADLQSDFDATTTALPPERDVSTLIAAINTSATNAGVSLDDFTFAAGEVSSKSTQTRKREENESAKINFIARGSLAQITNLLGELQRKIPLLAVSSLDADFVSTDRAQIAVVYYTKAFPPISSDDTKTIKGITPQNEILLNQLKEWQVPQAASGPDFTSSSSGEPF